MLPAAQALFDGAIRRGSAFLNERRWLEAVACFREALQIAPGHPDAVNCLGVMAFTMGDLITARTHFEQGLQADTGSELILTNLARVLYAAGDWESLRHLLTEAAQKGVKSDVLAALSSAAFRKKTGPKIFCLGRNKTGTTSLKHALRGLGFSLGYQPRGEMLLKDWHQRDFSRIAQLVETADAFQDTPFSLPGNLCADGCDVSRLQIHTHGSR